jgi:toxin ParE1/3/4
MQPPSWVTALKPVPNAWPTTPFMHRTGRAPGTREAVVHPNYIVIYEVGSDSVTIRSVIHSRRQYPPGD